MNEQAIHKTMQTQENEDRSEMSQILHNPALTFD